MTSTIRQTKAARKDRPWFLNADLKGLTHPSREGTPLPFQEASCIMRMRQVC